MPEKTAYIDESGNRSGIEGEGEHFVLASVAGSPAALGELEEKIRKLKLKLAPKSDPSGWELHASDIMHNRGASPLGTTSMDEKMSIMQGIVDAVNNCDVALFGAVVKSAAMRQRGLTPTQITKHATTLLVKRLERLAQEQKVDTLHVISDNTDEKYRLAMRGALRGRVRGNLDMPQGRGARVTGIRFVDSRSSALVQVTDTIAYIINRYIGGDTRFRGLLGDIARKAWRRDEPSGLCPWSGRRFG